MKIIIFQYNRNAAAIEHGDNLTAADCSGKTGARVNRFIASGYDDRFLWEEAASLRNQKPVEYSIVGVWQ